LGAVHIQYFSNTKRSALEELRVVLEWITTEVRVDIDRREGPSEGPTPNRWRPVLKKTDLERRVERFEERA